MDAQFGTHVLRAPRPASSLPRVLIVLLGALAACGGERPAAPPVFPALAIGATVLRLPGGESGGTVLIYRADSLRPLGWQSSAAVPAAAAALGYDLDQRLVYYLDRRRRLIGLDLEGGHTRTYAEGVRLATVGPDGAAYAVDQARRLIRVARRSATTFPARFPASPTELFGTLNGQVVAYRADSVPTLRLLSVEQSGEPVPLPLGPVASTYWGELVAVASGDQVTLLRANNPQPRRGGRLPAKAQALAFSPSGHQLLALTGNAVAVLDRFRGRPVATIRLPGPGSTLRSDPSGRWLLVRPALGDSVWVIDLATRVVAAAVPSSWRGGLPLIVGTGTLLTAEGPEVTSWDLTAAPARRTAAVVAGARDVWLAIPWVPAARGGTLAAMAAAAAAQDADLAVPDRDRGGDEPAVFVQVSSSQNPDWSRELAHQLSAAGLQAEVWAPEGPDDGYRVVIGPFGSRDEAEEAGRGLGRPFFILTRRPTRQP